HRSCRCTPGTRPLNLPSCPTRRSSDLSCISRINRAFDGPYVAVSFNPFELAGTHTVGEYPFLHPNPAAEPVVISYRRVSIIEDQDRKSTRLNSSHVSTSYAVFCL